MRGLARKQVRVHEQHAPQWSIEWQRRKKRKKLQKAGHRLVRPPGNAAGLQSEVRASVYLAQMHTCSARRSARRAALPACERSAPNVQALGKKEILRGRQERIVREPKSPSDPAWRSLNLVDLSCIRQRSCACEPKFLFCNPIHTLHLTCAHAKKKEISGAANCLFIGSPRLQFIVCGFHSPSRLPHSRWPRCWRAHHWRHRWQML